MKKDLISILMPTFNVVEFVEEAILSILNQTYQNFELIIVDDASQDGTFEILEKLSFSDSRIKLFKNEKNLKIADTLNLAYSLSIGNFILRMDGDDIALPNRIEILLNFLKLNQEYDLVGSQAITIDEKGNEINKSRFPLNEKNVVKGLDYKMSTVAHIWLAKREVYEIVGKYRIPSVEDYDFLLRMRSLGMRFINIDKYLYKIRIRDGNTASTSGLIQKLAADFVYKLYKERIELGYEKSCFHEFVNNKPNSFKMFLYSKSNYFLQKAVILKSKPIYFYFLVCISLLFSPTIQSKFLVNRYKYKKLD